MNELQKIPANNIQRILIDFQNQLQPILQSNQIVNDYTLLNGYINLVHSKFNKIVLNDFIENEDIFASKNHDIVEGNLDLSASVDKNTIAHILDLLWEKIHHPIFKWFQHWAKFIRTNNVDISNGKKKHYVEFRQMNSKLTKYFKSVKSFYYNIIEKIVKGYDLSNVISNVVITNNLNIVLSENDLKSQFKFEDDNPRSVLLVLALYRCLLYLGASHKYKKLNEIFTCKYNIENFDKSLKYLNIASLLLPSIGQNHLQMGLVYLQTQNYGLCIHELTRSITSRISSASGLQNFMKLAADKHSNKFKDAFMENLGDIYNKDIMKSSIVDREVIENYFTALYLIHLFPDIWLLGNSKDDIGYKEPTLINGLKVNTIEKNLKEKLSSRYSKCINLIFKNLLTVIGGFDLLLKDIPLDTSINHDEDVTGTNNAPNNENIKSSQSTQAGIKKIPLSQLTLNQKNYLIFAFKYCVTIIENINLKNFDKQKESFEYLAMVRIFLGWIQSYKSVLQFAHRDLEFSYWLGRLANAYLEREITDWESDSSKSPRSSYYFEEDVIVKDFSPVNFSLKDINFKDAFSSENKMDRLSGKIDASLRLSVEQEYTVRVKSIVRSVYQLFLKNKVAIKWDEHTGLFVLPHFSAVQNDLRKKKSFTFTEMYDQFSKTMAKDKKSANLVGVTELEAKLMRIRNTDKGKAFTNRGYSGSSIPTAPSNFATKPSSIIAVKNIQDADDSNDILDTLEMSTLEFSTNRSNVLRGNDNKPKAVDIIERYAFAGKNTVLNNQISNFTKVNEIKSSNIGVNISSQKNACNIENSDINLSNKGINDILSASTVNMSSSSLNSAVSNVNIESELYMNSPNNDSFITENDILNQFTGTIGPGTMHESNSNITKMNDTIAFKDDNSLKEKSGTDILGSYPSSGMIETSQLQLTRESNPQYLTPTLSQLPSQGIDNKVNPLYNQVPPNPAENNMKFSQQLQFPNNMDNVVYGTQYSNNSVCQQFPSQVFSQYPRPPSQQAPPQQFQPYYPQHHQQYYPGGFENNNIYGTPQAPPSSYSNWSPSVQMSNSGTQYYQQNGVNYSFNNAEANSTPNQQTQAPVQQPRKDIGVPPGLPGPRF
ncbi:hypothetical protein TPHA_0L01020 [Tetrapisispora phaffii CBS 4417]|uniref:Uncharacterized protein n=1 Tax=Tetrapisispora phaffii (strain ATCC 24235 / CBS 4417 / NBRC 1672 / NRRL Y-8282 / UCD 70-5) TaxID=1071381 RepID=G8BZY1_TETPH|nr:hypothetical protein TPHA_0L01020 [Tetrapisispora phaffii CBS 4417]CCE65459.1 hypothetical protein TPHA_0L01020 [Tetrapisispora phaffii CBS 4417]